MIDINKKYKTRAGETVRILATDRKDSLHPVVGLVTDDDGEELFMSWTEDGKKYKIGNSEDDLVEVVPAITTYNVLYKSGNLGRNHRNQSILRSSYNESTNLLQGIIKTTIDNGVVSLEFIPW